MSDVSKRDFPYYDYIGEVVAKTTQFGQILAWGAFGSCSVGVVALLSRAYNICRQRVQENEVPNVNCITALEEAAKRAVYAAMSVYTATNIAGASAKREDLETAISQSFNNARQSSKYDFKLVSFTSADLTKRDGNIDDFVAIVQDVSLSNTYVNITQNFGKIGSYEFNHFPNNTAIEKRADTCIKGKRCSEARTEFFGDHYIAADICKSSDFSMIDSSGTWMDVTMGHLSGTDYCADYYKLYTGHNPSRWDSSWRVYDGSGDYYWSKCDSGR